MTAPLLLSYICAALLFQLAVGLGVAVWRRHAGAAMPDAVAEEPSVSPGAWPGWREFRVARREYEDTARTQCSFYLEPADGAPLPPFKPGQFLTFSLQLAAAGPQGEGRTIIRCYSLSDRPVPSHYRITVKRVPAPANRPDLPSGASSTHFHDNVREGTVLKLKAPSGQFFIDPAPNVRAVLIAGGIGITPMMSMLRWCLAEQPERAVHLYYGLRHSGEHAFKPVLEQLAGSHPNLHLNVVYSRPGAGDMQGRDFQHAGHVDLDSFAPHIAAGPPSVLHLWSRADDGEPHPRARRLGGSSGRHSPRGVRACLRPICGWYTERRGIEPGGTGRGELSPLRPHAPVGRTGRELTRFRRAPRHCSRVWLPVRQLRKLRNEASLRNRSLRRHTGP